MKHTSLYGLLTVCLLLLTACSDVESPPNSVATQETQGSLDEADKQAAVDILQQSGVVDRIAGPQAWTASDFYQRPVGLTIGVYLIATWEQPVEYSGPWLDGDNCQGTRSLEFSSTWTGITQLGIIVDVGQAEVVHYMPYDPGRTNPSQEAPTTSQPHKRGRCGPGWSGYRLQPKKPEVIYEGPGKDAPQECPPGKEDD